MQLTEDSAMTEKQNNVPDSLIHHISGFFDLSALFPCLLRHHFLSSEVMTSASILSHKRPLGLKVSPGFRKVLEV